MESRGIVFTQPNEARVIIQDIPEPGPGMVLGQKKNPWSYDYELRLFQTILACCGGEAQ